MANMISAWNFNPRFTPNQEVWWVSSMLRKGEVIGIHFTKEYESHKEITYTVRESSGEVSREMEIAEVLLFPSREALLTFLEGH